MTPPTAKPTQPSLAALTARFLARPAAESVDHGVEPHEVTAGFATDARAAWSETMAVAKVLGVKDFPTAVPADWANYVRLSPAADFLPMAIGHFPQQVRDVGSLIGTTKKSTVTESRSWSVATAKQSPGSRVLAAAAARIGGQFAEANRLLSEAKTAGDDATAIDNERAAGLWHQGEIAAAVAIWKQLPASAVTAFNLGVAALKTGDKAAARVSLKAAIEQLPESSGWQHLAQLYLALA